MVRNGKKFLSLLLVVAMLASLAVVPAFADETFDGTSIETDQDIDGGGKDEENSPPECSCTVKCAEDTETGCPVCKTDRTLCKGTEPERTDPEPEQTEEQPETGNVQVGTSLQSMKMMASNETAADNGPAPLNNDEPKLSADIKVKVKCINPEGYVAPGGKHVRDSYGESNLQAETYSISGDEENGYTLELDTKRYVGHKDTMPFKPADEGTEFYPFNSYADDYHVALKDMISVPLIKGESGEYVVEGGPIVIEAICLPEIQNHVTLTVYCDSEGPDFSQRHSLVLGSQYQRVQIFYNVSPAELIQRDGDSFVCTLKLTDFDIDCIVEYAYNGLSGLPDFEYLNNYDEHTKASTQPGPISVTFRWDMESSKWVLEDENANQLHVHVQCKYVAPVAKIVETGVEYTTLQAAINAAQNGQTVEVLKDCTNASLKEVKKVTVNIPEGVTVTGEVYGLLVQGKGAELTITGAGTVQGGRCGVAAQKEGVLNVIGGEVKSLAVKPADNLTGYTNSSGLMVNSGAKATVSGDAIIKGGYGGISVGKDSTLEVTGGNVTGTGYGIVGNGTNDNTTISLGLSRTECGNFEKIRMRPVRGG